MRNKIFTKIILTTLMCAFLTMIVGKATRAYALAELAPEVAPVFDTQIYQLQDYIDHGGMSDPQLDIFYTLCGLYALGQAGSENYKLTNPYTTKSGVLNWLKDVGVEAYNTLISLAPDTVRLPNGTIMSTDAIKKATSLYVANLMGCALKAVDYDTFEEFEEDIDNSENYYIPWNKGTQYGLNTMFQLYGGIYEWQFDTVPFSSSVNWHRTVIPATSNYYTLVNNSTEPHVKFNYLDNYYNMIGNDGNFFVNYRNMFLNTSNNTVKIVDSSGNTIIGRPRIYFVYYNGTTGATTNFQSAMNNLTIPSADTYVQAVRQIYENGNLFSSVYTFYETFIEHVYVGDSWANRHEIFNVQDLNFAQNDDDQYYVTVPDEHNYLIDIKGILQDILDDINLYGVFIDNLISLDGVPVHDTDLIRVTTDIYELLNQENPPIPVDLNDFAIYADNDYLDEIKERSTKFGETIGEYFVFWHNADPVTVYVIFGSIVVILLGAFIGKLGHS